MTESVRPSSQKPWLRFASIVLPVMTTFLTGASEAPTTMPESLPRKTFPVMVTFSITCTEFQGSRSRPAWGEVPWVFVKAEPVTVMLRPEMTERPWRRFASMTQFSITTPSGTAFSQPSM